MAARSPDRYLNICVWAARRYRIGDTLTTSIGGNPAPFTRIEAAAWSRYMA